MNRETMFYCPECDEGLNLGPAPSRRGFLQAVGGAAAVAALATGAGRALAADAAKKPNPAEAMIRELYSSLSSEQKAELILPYDHKISADALVTRQRTFNSPALGKRLSEKYTKPQQELIQQAVRAILSSDEAFTRISRNGKWDSSGSFEGNGALLFGDPSEGGKFAWLFSGHHLTLRCDGDSQPGAAFGGPLYYGHSVDGDSPKNVYQYQTATVQSVFDALDEKQRTKAIADNNPGDGTRGLTATNPRHGIAYSELTADQKPLVEKVMRTLIEPFRAEDSNEVMAIVKANGGMEQIHIAFYKDDAMNDNRRWHFWRLEGPGFVWNYRVLPHVHCYVNIVNA